MKSFKEIETEKILSVSEYIERPDNLGGTAFVTLKDGRGTKGLHISLTRNEHTGIKKR